VCTVSTLLVGPTEIINGLQNEVTMFRQMCLNLQAEVSFAIAAAAVHELALRRS
jgi:hypothetical protein